MRTFSTVEEIESAVGEEIGTLRFSLCRDTNDEDIALALERLREALKEIS